MQVSITVILALMLYAQLSACTPTDRRQGVIKGQLVLLNGARDAFIKYERASELAIANAIPTQDPAREAVAAFRKNVRDPIVAAFIAAYMDLAEAAGAESDDPLAAAVFVIAKLKSYVDRFEVGKDPGPAPCSAPCSRF